MRLIGKGGAVYYSLGITIPHQLVRQLDLRQGDYVWISGDPSSRSLRIEVIHPSAVPSLVDSYVARVKQERLARRRARYHAQREEARKKLKGDGQVEMGEAKEGAA